MSDFTGPCAWLLVFRLQILTCIWCLKHCCRQPLPPSACRRIISLTLFVKCLGKEASLQLCTTSIGLCMLCLQRTSFPHACDHSATQGFTPNRRLRLRPATVPTPAAPAGPAVSPSRLQTTLPSVAERLPAGQMLPDQLRAPQLHPHAPSGQLHPQSQRIQLQGITAASFLCCSGASDF